MNNNISNQNIQVFNSRFNVEELGFQNRDGKYGIVLIVDQKVDVTVTKLTIGPFTLLSRFGGIIGVGQTLAWVINFCIDHVNSVYTNIRNILQKNK